MAWSSTNPTSFRINNNGGLPSNSAPGVPLFAIMEEHETHPSFGHLIMLVFEAILEVVCVSLPGYVIARAGHFDADKQKFLANLNVQLFTPCLIFTKLASQLNADKLADLAIIPIIFVIQTAVSYLVSIVVSKTFRLKRRPANFVTAMGVFGNSNSLPISLVISLSQTLKGLHWDRIPGDTDDEVAARGILYLLIFQQLGQLVRWSWGYHILLAPKSKYPEYQTHTIEEGRYRDDPSRERLIAGLDGYDVDEDTVGEALEESGSSDESDVYEPAGRTPVAGTSTASPSESGDEASSPRKTKPNEYLVAVDGENGQEPFLTPNGGSEQILSFPRMREPDEPEFPDGIKGYIVRTKLSASKSLDGVRGKIAEKSGTVFRSLPQPVQTTLGFLWRAWLKVYNFLWEFMNPPLWAMLIAIVVASVPDLQRLFFDEDTFVNNSVTRAVSQSAGVAVPLILVVLGANLARNTQPQESKDPEEAEIGTRLLVASLVSRMLLPTLIMAPIIALFVKLVPVSILDDPIFVIVCFLLTGAPSALQLAQICQLNEVYEGVMAKILFQSYVIWILPSTLILVMLALEVVEWALL